MGVEGSAVVLWGSEFVSVVGCEYEDGGMGVVWGWIYLLGGNCLFRLAARAIGSYLESEYVLAGSKTEKADCSRSWKEDEEEEMVG